MSPQHITTEKKDGIFTLTLNRPAKRNAFVNEMMLETWEAVNAADADNEVRVIVITGAGDGFSSGADVDAFKAAYEESKRKGYQVAAIDQVQLERFAVAFRKLSVPLIAAVNGPAIGLGFTVAIACDIRIASEKAQFGAAFVRMGLTPEFGGSYNLPRLVGIAKACELVLQAKVIGAQEAREIGLVNQVVPHEQLMPRTLEMAQAIAALPPMAVRYSKRNMYKGLDSDLATAVHDEIMANRICRDSKDHGEGIAAFLEKRKPNYTGR
jgi:2-(1,2-epoxy-1,2-dihydrophenyl)acetyl-CoA isomerase